MTSPRPVWQEPYVEVLRHGLAHRSVGWQQQGDVEQVSDALIHKNVFKIRGTIAATNYMRIPRDVVQGTYGLGLTGRYVYIQLRRIRDLPLLLHMDLVTSKKTTLRFSLSSMYTALRSTGTVLRVPLQLNKSWTTVVIDMAELLACHTFNDYCRENYRCLKAVTCCAAMNLRNIFTSSTLYTTETLPVALALPVAHAAQGGPYVLLSLPADDMKNYAASHRKTPTKARQRSESNYEEVEDTTSETEYAAVSPIPATPLSPLAPTKNNFKQTRKETTFSTHESSLSPRTREAHLLHDRQNVLTRADQILRDAGFAVGPQEHPAVSSTHNQSAPAKPESSTTIATRKPVVNRKTLSSIKPSAWPDPILELTRILGVSTEFPNAVQWIPHTPHTCVYTSHSTIVFRECLSSKKQEAIPSSFEATSPRHDQMTLDQLVALDDQEIFLTGHTGPISALVVSHDGARLASAENIPIAVLRLWDIQDRTCLTMLQAPTKSIHALSFSPDGNSLCVVGKDDRSRTQIFVWDCSGFNSAAKLTPAKKLSLRARQTCDYEVQAIAFSPYDALQLVSCGRENIRFWRLNTSRPSLFGSPVILKEYARGTTFTSLAFDRVYPLFPSDIQRLRPLYVASSVGTLLVVDSDSREVVCVYKLHDAAIHSLAINEGFCVTGSEDRFLRVWPLDFSDFFLEAQHEAPVRSVDVSHDGLRVVVGSANGAVGILALADQHYDTVLRSHTETVHALTVLPNDPNTAVTSADDGTMRVWDIRSGRQRMEFDVTHDRVTCITAIPGSMAQIAVGFASGCTRIFALEEGDGETTHDKEPTEVMSPPPRVVHEFQQHQSPLCDLKYQSDGETLYTLGQGQQLCMFDVERRYAPIKMLLTDVETEAGDCGSSHLCLSRDQRFLATLQRGRRAVLLLDTVSLCVVHTLTPPSPTSNQDDAHSLQKVVISWNSQELLALTRSDRLFIFSLREKPGEFGRVLHSMPLLGQGGITSLTLSRNFKYLVTGGRDGSVRVWQCDAGKHTFQRMYQSFVLYRGAENRGQVTNVSFTSLGNRLIATSAASSAVFLWQFHGDAYVAEQDEMVVSRRKRAQNQSEDEDVVPEEPRETKTQFHLSLDRALSLGNQMENIATQELRLEASTSRIPSIRWSSVLSGWTPSLCVWACTNGLFGFAVDGVLVVEELDTGAQHTFDDHAGHELTHVVLSRQQDVIATTATSLTSVVIRKLGNLRGSNNQENHDDKEDDGLLRVHLPSQIHSVQTLVFSLDGRRLCFSCTKVMSHAGQPVHAIGVVNLTHERNPGITWLRTTHCHPVTRLHALDNSVFLVSYGEKAPFERLEYQFSSPTEFKVAMRTSMDAVVPGRLVHLCFRDEGCRGATPTPTKFAIGVDRERFCYLYDLDQERMLLTTQLLAPSPSLKGSYRSNAVVSVFEWVTAKDWEALLVIQDASILVYPLPLRSSRSQSSPSIDWKTVARIGLACGHIITLDQPIASLLVDSFRAVAMAVSPDGATTVVQLRTSGKRSWKVPIGYHHGVNPQLAAFGTVLLTLSHDGHALRCWEPGVGRELTRFQVDTTVCTCFALSLDSMSVLAGYTDGSLRIFSLNDWSVIAQFTLPARRSSSTKAFEPVKDADEPRAQALRVLKQQREMGSPDKRETTCHGFRDIRYIGQHTALCITVGDDKVLAMDFSEAIKTKSTARNTKYQREKTVSFRELVLKSWDRHSRTPLTKDYSIAVEHIDVNHLLNKSPPRSNRKESKEPTSDPTQPFLVVLRVENRRQNTRAWVVHVFPATHESKVHPVHGDGELAPMDTWAMRVEAMTEQTCQALFHPTSPTLVFYPVFDMSPKLDQEPLWGIEIRDFTQQRVLQRVMMPSSSPLSTPPIRFTPWDSNGQAKVLISDQDGRMAVIDLDRSTLKHIKIPSGYTLCTDNSQIRPGQDVLLRRRDDQDGLVLAQLT